jgi:hypothetical protein
MPDRWCTVTVVVGGGQRHSLDLLASSTYDAAHLYLTHAKTQRHMGLPVPTLSTVFEVVTEGRIHRVAGTALQRWIEQRRQTERGPRGALFRKRPSFT